MKKKSHVPRSPRGDSASNLIHLHNQPIVIPMGRITAFAESFEKKERSWYVTSQIPTDVVVQIQDITFYIHKYPLLSKSGYMSRLNLLSSSDCNIKLDNFPGGSDTFHLVLRFCYGLPIDLTPYNVSPLRCASEFLEMSEEMEEGNLISRTESFLTFTVLTSWRHSITVLASCQSLSPWAENLLVVRRCTDSIAWKATREQHLTRDGGGSSIDQTSDRGEAPAAAAAAAVSDVLWWFNDVSTLPIQHFVRIITSVRAKGARPESVGACIAHYAARQLPGGFEGGERSRHDVVVSSDIDQGKEMQLSISSGRRGDEMNRETRMMIESLVSLLPPERESVRSGFLLWMLKMGIVYSVTPAMLSELEMRAGMVLEEANVDHLLIPNYPINITGDPTAPKITEEATMYNVEIVQRIVEYFLMHEQHHQQNNAEAAVAKLLDGYLAEIARDPYLSVPKFQVLAESLPANARTCDDGLYRAIDTYLKAHPSLTEHERRRLCRVMECSKLSFDACLHAAQNERLPLRTVVQVLFTEQVKIRAAVATRESSLAINRLSEEESNSEEEIKRLIEEVEKMKAKVGEIQQGYWELQQELNKYLGNKRYTAGGGWSLGYWRRMKGSTFFLRKMEGGDGLEEMQQKRGGFRLRGVSIS